jgi:DNA mismatch repair protein MutS2
LDEKSLQLLEFPRVRDIVAGFTTFPASRELAEELLPTTDQSQIYLWLEQSAEARRLLAQESGFSLGDVVDVRSLAVVAARGKVLEPAAFLGLQRTLQSSRNLRNHMTKRAAEFPRLWEVASRVTALPVLEKEISRVLNQEGEVLDSASPKLADLRQRLRSVRQEILRRLDSLIRTPHPPEYLQDSLITEREGRYVIPVKAEFRREVPGIVHDMSNTGATVFMEPFATVELGNELREAALAEKHEVENILTVLSGEVGLNEAALLQNMAALAELDLALAKARYAHRVQAVEPQIMAASSLGGKPVLRLIEARHPLLRGKAVPLTVEVGRDFTVLVITGPNTGGKTVALKTIGLLALMAQAGLPVPAAEGTVLPVFDGVYADIGDEQSIEQTLSTFSWHMGHIVRIIQQSTKRSLVLMDELGTGTAPAEGAALAQAILQHFRDQGALSVVTTHFEALKVFAHTTPGLQNAAMAFDPVTLRPIYHLTIGIPGGSNALATAAQLGLPEAIIEVARGRLDKDTQQMEALMTDLAREKQAAEIARAAAEAEKTAAADLRRELEEQRAWLVERKEILLREARDSVVAQAAELSRQLKETAAELKRARSQEAVQQARQSLAAVHQKLEAPAWQPRHGADAAPRTDPGEIKVGDRVWLSGTNLQGTVLNVSNKDDQLEVQAGAARFRLSRQNVTRISGDAGAEVVKATGVTVSVGRGIESLELDLRGRRADAVIAELDSYLNNASLFNVGQVCIIHGHGTGVVRQIVRDFLATHPLVRSFRPGEKGEGGDGVTVVKL